VGKPDAETARLMNGLPFWWYFWGWVNFIADTASEVWRLVKESRRHE
jgi:hypothetical protein